MVLEFNFRRGLFYEKMPNSKPPLVFGVIGVPERLGEIDLR